MEMLDYIVSAHGMVVFQVFENYYVHEVLYHPTSERVCRFGFQGENRFEIYICSSI